MPNLINERRTLIEALQLLEKLAPMVAYASQLHAAGIRIAISKTTPAALAQMALEGNQQAELVLANTFANGHLEVALVD